MDCLNCGAPMVGPYCASCGQKQPHPDLTLGELVHEATEELTHWDGKVPATLKTLFLKPGQLTTDFLAGRRARWLSPLRLYLICSVVFFLSGPLVEAITHREMRELAKVTVKNKDGSTTLNPDSADDLENSDLARLIGRERLERVMTKTPELNRTITAAFPKAMFLLLPLFALLTRAAWRRKVARYPAHLYLSLHLHAAWFGAFAVAKLVGGFATSDTVGIIVGTLAAAYVVWYGLVSFRRVFGDSWGKTIAKTALIAPVYGTAFMAVSFGLLAYAVASM